MYAIVIIEICNGVRVLSTNKNTLNRLLLFTSMMCIAAYVSIVYANPYSILTAVVVLVCALLSKDKIFMLFGVLCVLSILTSGSLVIDSNILQGIAYTLLGYSLVVTITSIMK